MTLNDLNRRNGVSLWRQIAGTLEAEIAEGQYKPGDRLPTEFALAERFTVNRHTVRRALAVLEEQGLIRIEQGRGSFVREPVIDYAVGLRTRFSENLNRQSRRADGRLLYSAETLATAPVGAALAVEPGTPVIVLETIGMADERPVSVATHHFPKWRFQGLVEAYRRTGSITQGLRHCGVDDYRRRITRVTARLPSPADAQHLQQDRARPILVAESINVDAAGEPIEFGIARFNGDWVQIVFEPGKP